jgi:uncharacterized protein YaaW (UPF0174 family)
MAYRSDSDLKFLADVASSDLDSLVETLIKGKDGSERLTEELTINDRYRSHSSDHHQYWDLIAAEIQCFGANSLATIFRGGEGVLYKEVLTDVCDKMKVNYNKDASVEIIEMNLLMKMLTEAMKGLSADELKKIVEDLNLNTTNFTAQAVTVALQGAIRFSGFAAYQVALIVANAVAKALLGSGLKLATNAALTRAMSVFAGPIGWSITGLWTFVDIAGPAYRVTIPAVIQVAFLRAKIKYGGQNT